MHSTFVLSHKKSGILTWYFIRAFLRHRHTLGHDFTFSGAFRYSMMAMTSESDKPWLGMGMLLNSRRSCLANPSVFSIDFGSLIKLNNHSRSLFFVIFFSPPPINRLFSSKL